MQKEQLTINTATRTCDTQIFAGRKSAVKSQRSHVKCSPKGFTLVEMIVSLGLFTIIMFIATSAFLSIVNTDRKARSVRIAIDNLNITLEDMSRRIKTGSAYYCGINPNLTSTLDCSVTPSNSFSFTDQDLSRVIYRRSIGPDPQCGAGFKASQGCILRNGVTVTSPEIDITSLKFLVSGSTPCGAVPPCVDTKQPVVVIVIDGSVGAGTASTTFKIQTTVTQRAYDNQ